jgi:hypothetical protein
MDRFLRYTTQKELALTASFLAAVLLAIAARYLGLTDEDLAVLGPVSSSWPASSSGPGCSRPTPSAICSIPGSGTSRDRPSLPGLPARDLASRPLPRLRRRDDDAARVWGGLAEASGAAATAAPGVPVAACW